MNRFIKRPIGLTIASLLTLFTPFLSYSLKFGSDVLKGYVPAYELIGGSDLGLFSIPALNRCLLIAVFLLIAVHLILLFFTEFCERGSQTEIALDIITLVLAVVYVLVSLPGSNIHTLGIDVASLTVNDPSIGAYLLVLLNVIQLVINVLCINEKVSDEDHTLTITEKDNQLIGKVVGITGPYASAEVPVHVDEQLAIGRDPEVCNLIIDSMSISKIHCYIQIKPETGNYLVMDMSLNGTFLQDGSRLPKGTYVEVKPDVNIYLGTPDNTFYLSKYA